MTGDVLICEYASQVAPRRLLRVVQAVDTHFYLEWVSLPETAPHHTLSRKRIQRATALAHRKWALDRNLGKAIHYTEIAYLKKEKA